MSVEDGFSTDTDGRSFTRYDTFLLALPLSLLAGVASGVVSPLPTPLCVGAGGLPSVLLLGYGLFVDSPDSRPPATVRADGGTAGSVSERSA
jgi:hypothetical protein